MKGLGIIGVGAMGGALARRLAHQGRFPPGLLPWQINGKNI